MTAHRSLLLAALVVALPGLAAAESDEAPAAGATRLTAPHRRLVVHALLELSLSKDAAGKPISIAPDVWYGLTPGLTVGLVHSSRALTGILGGAGDGLCITGDSGGCGRFYDHAGLVARVHLRGGRFAVALDGGLIAGSFDPLALALKVGIAARWQLGKLAAEVVPSVWLGLTERDAGNIETMYVPLSVTSALAPRLAVAGQVGMVAPFDRFRQEVVIATSVGVQAIVSDQLVVDVAFSLPHWLDTDRATYGLDARTFTVGAGRAF